MAEQSGPPAGPTATPYPPDQRPDYDASNVDELQKLADERSLVVVGTGSGGNVIKADLVHALQAHDQARDTSGRPDLTDLAAERAANRTPRVKSALDLEQED